jgi:hypothetical protein
MWRLAFDNRAEGKEQLARELEARADELWASA